MILTKLPNQQNSEALLQVASRAEIRAKSKQRAVRWKFVVSQITTKEQPKSITVQVFTIKNSWSQQYISLKEESWVENQKMLKLNKPIYMSFTQQSIIYYKIIELITYRPKIHCSRQPCPPPLTKYYCSRHPCSSAFMYRSPRLILCRINYAQSTNSKKWLIEKEDIEHSTCNASSSNSRDISA